MTLLYTVSAGTGSTNPYEMGYTFTEDFYKSVIFIVSSDTDNNSDNFYKVCSQRHSEYATSSYGNYWNTNTDEWNYFKMSPPSGTGFPGTNSKYSDSNTIDKNKDIYWATGTSSANIFVNIAYKDNIKINDVVWLYVNSYRRSCSFIFGLK